MHDCFRSKGGGVYREAIGMVLQNAGPGKSAFSSDAESQLQKKDLVAAKEDRAGIKKRTQISGRRPTADEFWSVTIDAGAAHRNEAQDGVHQGDG
jgi:hypothetical protein